MQLSKTEESLMNHIWKLEKALMKDLLECYPEPKPALTTIATLLKRMNDKGFVGFEKEGRSRKYYALVTKEDYVSNQLKGFVNSFFGDSTKQFASFFTRSSGLTKEELEDLKSIIDQQIKDKK